MEKVAQETLDAAKAFKEKIDPCSVTIPIKAGENGKVFGSVAAQNIAEAAKEQLGFDIDKKKIQLPPLPCYTAFHAELFVIPDKLYIIPFKRPA